MGDVLDMMEDGYLCKDCGDLIDDQPLGSWATCEDCEKENNEENKCQ